MSETAVPTWVTDMDDPEVLQRALNIAADPTAPSSGRYGHRNMTNPTGRPARSSGSDTVPGEDDPDPAEEQPDEKPAGDPPLPKEPVPEPVEEKTEKTTKVAANKRK